MFEAINLVSEIKGVFSENYDGGEFCKGLLFSKDASKIFLKLSEKVWGSSAAKASPKKAHQSKHEEKIATHHANF